MAFATDSSDWQAGWAFALAECYTPRGIRWLPIGSRQPIGFYWMWNTAYELYV